MCPPCFVAATRDPCSVQLLLLKGNQMKSQEAKTPAQHFGKLNSVY